MARMLIGAGIFLIVLGIAWKYIGKLPGDIVIKKENMTFYFPIVTCIIISVVLSLISYFFSRFK
ncbi:MAG: DUF2905 domain-containing protein [Bacillaceae bacterium]